MVKDGSSQPTIRSKFPSIFDFLPHPSSKSVAFVIFHNFYIPRNAAGLGVAGSIWK